MDEGSLLNALIAFKTCSTYKQMSIVVDLEQILMGNLEAVSIQTLSQVLYNYSKVSEEGRKNRKFIKAVLNRLISVLRQDQANILDAADIF